MKKLTLILLSILILSNVSFGENKIAETWNGKLEVGITLRISFNITDTSGTLFCTMDSPDQGAFDIPMDSIFFANDTLRIVTVQGRGQYLGVFDESSGEIDGTWVQNGMSFELDLEKGAKTVLNRPQEPTPPFPYNVEEVTYENQEAGITLAGTLTSPKETEPIATVLMITGSGAQDRDEALLGHKPFLVIADYLTRKGIAVLRVDDRGVGGSTGNPAIATTEDFVGDVYAGIEYLKSRPDVDPKRIGLIGHSEGAIIASWIASESEDVAFIVMMAGTGMRGDALLVEQLIAIMMADGKSDKYIEESLTMQFIGYELMRNYKDSISFASSYKTAYKDWAPTITDSALQADLAKEDPSMINLQISQAGTPWFRFFIDYDPIPAIEKIKCPVLSMIGTKDVQVPYALNNPPIEEALKKAGNKHYRIENLESMNHLFQTCETGQVSEYGEIEETISPKVLEMMTQFINEVSSY